MKIEVHRFPTLDAARQDAARQVDEAAEAARLRYITPGAGQAMEYEAAASEAAQHAAGAPGPWPMLQAEVDAGLSADLAGAAQAVASARAAWSVIGAEIRRIRLAGKFAILNADTYAAVVQARIAAIAELEGV